MDFGAIGFGAVTLKIVPGAKIVPAYVIHSNPFQTCLATDDRVARCLATGDRVE